ncbi:DUF1654 domain-containing protein [Pseudomonas aeruginosa]|nr:DUF1654 domain-containing protein [Pseudomonas aeruginosa]
MINSPRAQAERRASIWKTQGDSEEAWQQVLEELARNRWTRDVAGGGWSGYAHLGGGRRGGC